MDAAKIRLSPEEAALVVRADVILTKNRIIQKARQLLENLAAAQQELLRKANPSLPDEVIASVAKISKGENYRGLPYLVLDHPRLFARGNIFAIRTLFWWGNFFSTTLHLSGEYKMAFGETIVPALEVLKERGFFICANEDPWEHHFEPDNYMALTEIPREEAERMIRNRSFIKLSTKIGLDQWDNAEKSLLEIFSLLIDVLTAQLPSR